MNSCWLTLVHTLALLRTWPCTLSYGVFLIHNHTHAHTHTHAQTHTHTHAHTHTHTHTHVQRTCTHQLYMWQTIHLSDDGTNTLTHKHCHMHMYSIQFNCTCASLYRPLILCKFVYQAFCTCIVSPRIEYIVSPSGTLNVHKHCTLAHTHHCINVAIHAHTQHIDTQTHT